MAIKATNHRQRAEKYSTALITLVYNWLWMVLHVTCLCLKHALHNYKLPTWAQARRRVCRKLGRTGSCCPMMAGIWAQQRGKVWEDKMHKRAQPRGLINKVWPTNGHLIFHRLSIMLYNPQYSKQGLIGLLYSKWWLSRIIYIKQWQATLFGWTKCMLAENVFSFELDITFLLQNIQTDIFYNTI